MTETSPLATDRPRAKCRRAREDERFRRAAMAGVPVPLVELRIRGDDGKDAPWDGKTVGEIQVHGPFITGSYHRVAAERGQVHRRRVAAHRRRRGDGRARLRPHHRPHQGPDQVGRRMDLVGRPGERADGASGHRRGGGDRDPRPEVERAAAGLHRLEAGRRIAPAEIADVLGKHLLGHGFAKWQLPERYEVIDGVPRTSTGKFWKLKLRERFPR